MATAYLAVVSGLPRKTLKLEPGSNIVGRAPDAALLLSHVSISRYHCRFYWDGETCTVEDLGSQRGTRVNGNAIDSITSLQPGDKLSVGPALLEFGIGELPALPDRQAEAPLEAEIAPLLLRGAPASRIDIPSPGEELILGRDPQGEVVLGSPEVSRRHATLRRDTRGSCLVTDLNSTGGSFVNGRRFDTHELTIGDRLQIGPFCFQYDGRTLARLDSAAGGRVDALNVTARAGNSVLLDGVTLQLPASQFIGIIGPSGAGKSTLLHTLAGLREPQRGRVLIDGNDVYGSGAKRSFGFVPQEDIVHPELTVMEALRYGAELRLPASTPGAEIQKLILQTLDQLGLRERAELPIHRLSGGQRKRVSVAVELLAKPSVLFLDEPSSGLDPATEFQLMELLRDLADTGCTIVCTTHVMEHAYLMDQLVILSGGCLAFQGTAQEARDYFGVNKLAALYDCLQERPGTVWRDEWTHDPRAKEHEPKPQLPYENASSEEGSTSRMALPILLRRQGALLTADWRNLLILFGQPLLIAALVSWVTDDQALVLFFAYIATLWFGCSNGAQEIVKEVPIYRRERLIGVGAHSYLTSKFLSLSLISVVQTLLLWGGLLLGERGTDGAMSWQAAGLLGIALVAVGIGLVISALARTVMQAVLVVPLLIIPQILFSGYTVPAHEMRPAVHAVSRATPTFSAQATMDTSFLWEKKIARDTLSDHWTSFRNLNRDGKLKTGEIYRDAFPALLALVTLGAWLLASYIIGWWGLRMRERQ
ncbi:FHA domain-containing protein [Verrucomicrobiota bacterium sgz303538]